MQHIPLIIWLQILAAFVLGFGICWPLIGVILKRIERGVGAERRRDFHHTHKVAIPRLGGVAIVSAFVVVVVVIYISCPMTDAGVWTLGVIACGSLAMFALGLWDDLRAVGAKTKLAAQIMIASGVYLADIRVELFKDPLTETDLTLGFWGYFGTVFWLVALTNLINLIDGIDGLAAGIGIMLMLLMANLGVADNLGFSMLLSIGMAGALLGFLKYNYPPAKIYMGDGGAYFLGFLIGILSIVNSNKGTVVAALIAPAFALALPIVDVSLAILRRGLRGLPIFRPDQRHIHHRLLTLGISRERTLLNLYTVSLLCLTLAVCVFCVQGRLLPLYTGLLVLVLIVAGHLSGFTKDWSGFGGQLGKSLKLRKETRYALTLDRWFVMAAARHNSLKELREDYWFVVRKLGFAKVSLALPDGATFTWSSDEFDKPNLVFQQGAHEISDGTTIEFFADKKSMTEDVFVLLGDLASESWYKAALHCGDGKKSAAIASPVDDLPKTDPRDDVIGFKGGYIAGEPTTTAEL